MRGGDLTCYFRHRYRCRHRYGYDMDINTDIDPCPYTFSLDSSESQSRTMLPVIQLQPVQYFLTTFKKMVLTHSLDTWEGEVMIPVDGLEFTLMTTVWAVGKYLTMQPTSTGNWFQEHDNPPELRALEEHGVVFANNPLSSSCKLYFLKIALELIEMKGYKNGPCLMLFMK